MNIRLYSNVMLFLALIGTVPTIHARNNVNTKLKHKATGEPPKINPNKGIDLIENKGQWVSDAKFRAAVPGGLMYFTDKGFLYQYLSQEDMHRIHDLVDIGKKADKEIVHQHAYRVNFVGANPNPTYKSEQKRSNYSNYFLGNDRSKWASSVGSFGKVTQQNIYNGIDVTLYGKGKSLKYDFLVASGADASKIVLAFEGVAPELTKEGNLRIKTSVNEVIEQAPYAYQIIDGKEVTVTCNYKLDKGRVTFNMPDGYNKSLPLVIDPVLVFATYSGADNGNSFSGFYGFSTTYDADGNAYAGSGAFDPGWPTTLGALQPTYGGSGSRIVAVNKYNATGTDLIYSTYYGGTGEDLPHTMLVNDQNELIIGGSTFSNNLPLSTGSYQSTLSGGSDIFIAHFNSTGTGLIGSTYIGGSQNDPTAFTMDGADFGVSNQNVASPIQLTYDNTGNIWVASSTPSSDFPVTTNAAQNSNSGGNDGVIFKLSPDCSQLLYSSYLGGSSDDGAMDIIFNNDNNLVVCGITNSADFLVTPDAMIGAGPGGGFDGFVCIIDPVTGVASHSTYLGTDQPDHALRLQVDNSNNVFVMGRTAGDYPISTGVYNVAGGDVFIDKLNPTLSSSLLSTRLGNVQTGNTFDMFFPDAFLQDICGNVYICGLQPLGSVNDMPLTADAFQNDFAPFWFGVLEPNFTGLLYGSYFGTGSDHSHVGTSRLDPQGIVYHSICNSEPYPFTDPSVWAPTTSASGQDIVTFKFNFEATGVNSNFKLDTTVASNDTGCAPYTVKFDNISTSSITYIWDFGDGSPTSTLEDPTHTFMNPGTFIVTLYAHNDSSCITDDTSYMTFTILQTAVPEIIVNDTILCTFEQSIDIGVTINNPSPNNTINWGPSSGILSGANQPIITVDPSVNNTYWVTVKDTIPGICGFSSSDTVHINLRPRVLDIINNDTVVCEGTIVPILAIGTAGYTYLWSPATGVSDTTALMPTITVNQPNLYTLTSSYPGCPDTSVDLQIGMHYTPDLKLGADQYVCQWTDVALESTITPFRNDYIYQWAPATSNLSDPTGPNTHFIADSTITYHLNVKTPIGCSDDDSITVTVYPGGFGGIVSDTGYCPGNLAPLWASGGVSYSWTPAYGLSDTSIANPVASPSTSTDYTVYIKDIHNCLDTEKVSIQVYPEAVLALPDSITVYPGEQYHIEPGTNCLYFSWFPPSGLSGTNISDPLMSPEVRTRYFVNATTENGCIVSDSIDVLVNETVLDMPNAFAPSGANNLFKPSKRGIAQLKSFTIFNRWGNKVYSSTNIDQGWDGTFNGKPQPLGVYVYAIEAVSDSGKTFTQQGNVTLIR